MGLPPRRLEIPVRPPGPPKPNPHTPPPPAPTPHAPVGQALEKGCCGPDVTGPLIGVLRTVIMDFRDSGIVSKASSLNAFSLGAWSIHNLRDTYNSIRPDECGCPPNTPCAGTVMVFGKCFSAGAVNYALYGVIQELMKTLPVPTGVVSGMAGGLHALYWFGKELSGVVSDLTGAKDVNVPGLGKVNLPGTSISVGLDEYAWITVGQAFAAAELSYWEAHSLDSHIAITVGKIISSNSGGAAAMEAAVGKLAGLACSPCPQPPKITKGWRYVWGVFSGDRVSRY